MRQFLFIAIAGLLFAASSALAVKTQYWTHTSAEDFKKGTANNVVVTNHGELRLARELKSLLPADQHITAIPALTETSDGAIVFGTFPDGKVVRLKDGKTETLATFAEQTITSLAADDAGAIYVGVAGEKGEIFKITQAKEKPQIVFTQEDVRYVWSILPREGKLILGTGCPARIWEADADGQAKTIAKLDGDNVLSLISAADGTLYAGTDRDGLVYRIDRNTNKTTLLFDAPEAEISSLALDDKGNLLVGTGDVKQQLPAPAASAVGRPEHGGGASTIPSQPPAVPRQPDGPAGADPIPGEAPDTPVHTDAIVLEPASKPAQPTGPVQPAATPQGADAPAGNALYRVDPRGFAVELFRESVVIYAIVVQEDSILLATGDSGEIYEIKPASEETAILARTEATQASGIVKSKSGQIYLATSNAGAIWSLGADLAKEGSFESEALDATALAKFGKMQLRGQLPEGTSLTVSTRSGNSADPKSGAWSDWSAPIPAREFMEISAPDARYLQYKVILQSTQPKKSPGVDEIGIAYQKPNVAPRIASVTVSADAATPGNRTIAWEAADANEDTLQYAVYARAIGRGGWMELGKELTASPFTWIGKQAADGRYEIKVVASDASDNQPGEGQQTSRVSDTVVIDNTAPVIGDIKIEPADRKTTVTLRVVDRNGVVASLDYAIDSAQHWQRSLPDDTMADSPEERYTLSLTGLTKGSHTLTVRATDSQGQSSFETVALKVP